MCMGGDAVFLGSHVPTVAFNSQPSNKLVPNDVTSSLEKIDGTRLFAAAQLNSSV